MTSFTLTHSTPVQALWNISPPASSDFRMSSKHEEGILDSMGKCLREILVPIVCIFGVIGNLLNIIILSRKRVKQTLQTQENIVFSGLIALAVSDMLFCVTAFPRCFVAENKALFTPNEFGLFYQLYCTGVLTMFSLLSTWLIVIMAVFRYIAICHPLHLREWLSVKRAYAVMAAVLVFCIGGNLPSFWQFEADTFEIGDETLILVDIGPLNHNTHAGLAFQWIKKLVGVFVPVLILGYCNMRLIIALRASERMRKQHTVGLVHKRVASPGKQITLTLIVIIVMYIMLVYPSELMDFCTHLVNIEISNPELFLFFRAFANLLHVTNFACNFILYCFLNAQFRQVVREFILCSRRYSERRWSVMNLSRRTSKTVASLHALDDALISKSPGMV